jgi:N-acetylglucosaminyl-diphospho-decaprenol L-rhamnosyltransferase
VRVAVGVVVTCPDCTVRTVLAVVVVTYSAVPDDLDRTLTSIRSAGGADLLIVVDTGGTASPSDAAIEVLRMENRGFGAAANVGAARAIELGATMVAILNDDVEVRPQWLALLRAELHGAVGAVQPKLVLAGTDPPLVNSLGVHLDRYGAGIDIGDGELDEPGGAPHDIEIFTGGAVLCSVDFLAAVGGFDERYFLYYEDVDLARRGAELGWRYRCVPEAVVEHARGLATSTMPDRTRFLQERNRLWCAVRFADPATVGRAFWLSLRRVRHAPRRVHARALLAGLTGAPQRLWERRRAVRRTAGGADRDC